jgi:hypothetical protein
VASEMCLSTDGVPGSSVQLGNCSSSNSKWTYSAVAKGFRTVPSGSCLATSADSTGMLRVNVTVAAAGSAACNSPSSQWAFDQATRCVAEFDLSGALCFDRDAEDRFERVKAQF